MSDDTTEPEVDVEAVEDDAPPSRIAGALVALILAGAAVLIVRAVVTAFPYVAYFVAGVIVTVVGYRSAGWVRKRRGDAVEEPAEEEPDVGEALRTLSAGGNNVLLTGLCKQLGAADTKTVRKLLKAEKIRVRPGVRTPTGNGPGVHHEDIPAAPPEPNAEHGDGCCCRSANNTNANNTQEDPSQKGLSVEPIGQAGTLIRDLAETEQRRTQISAGALVDRLFAFAEKPRKDGSGES